MIKINLLGVAPPPTAAAAGAPATRTFQITIFVGSLVVCFAIVGVFYRFWSGEVAQLQKSLKQEQSRESELAGVKAQNDRYQQHLKDLETRINTIQALQSSRVGPVEFMTALSNVVNRTRDLYLFTVSPQGGRLVMRGQSESVDSMANFLSSLKSSGYFDDVQLRQFYEDDQENRLSFKFSLDCVYKPLTAAAAAAPTGTPASTATPGRRGGM